VSKIINHFGLLALSAVLLTPLLFLAPHSMPVTASAEPLRWTKVNIPADGEAGNWVLASGSDIQRLALASDGSIYACVQGLANSLYRSNDGGLGWTSIGNVADNIIGMALSPRDPNRVYYATKATVYRSTNGGKTFSALPASPGGAGTGHKEIISLDVTSLDSSIIAVGTRDTGSAQDGGVYILDESLAVPAWADTGLAGNDVLAVAFSPGYPSDRQLIAVTTNETDTFVVSKIGDAGWNVTTGRIRLNRDNATPLAPVVASSATIAFPHNYSADPAAERNIFYVGVGTGNNLGDVYKIDFSDFSSGAASTDLNTGQTYGYNNLDIAGLVAAGDYPAAVLIAGDSHSARTYTSADGGRTWTKTRKDPTGDAVTGMLTGPYFSRTGKVYLATSGANSALSVTSDGGLTWNQVSLIDTGIDNIIDLAPSPHYASDSTIFMLTYGGGPSLWRSRNAGDSWERIFAYRPGSVDELKEVGLSPRYGDESSTVLVAGVSNGRPAVWQSTDDGQTYRCRFARDPETGAALPIDAWVVFDENSFFIGSYNGSQSNVYRTTTAGFVCNEGTAVGNQQLTSLAISPFFKQDGTILAGNNGGWVYISKDNSNSYRPLPDDATSPPFNGSVTVVFDPHYDKNHTVYASSDDSGGGIYRFNTLSGQEWSNIDATLPASSLVNHLAAASEGTLYAANFKANGGMERCLFPTTSSPVFESVTRYLPDGATLSGLWQSDHRLWTIDTTNNRLLSFYDTLTMPTGQTAPSNLASGLGNLSDHTVKNVVIDWAPLEGATSYQWQCDYSPDFTSVPATLDGTTTASGVRLPALEPATTYHWRVRANAPFLSPWSAEQTFTTSLDTEVVTLQTESPAAGARQVPLNPTFQWTAISGASAYELLVSTHDDFDHPVVVRTGNYAIPTNAWQCDVSLDYLTTYYWRVRAVNRSTLGPWSATGIFTTELSPVDTPGTTSVTLLQTAPATAPPLPTAPVPAITGPAAIKPAPTSSPLPDLSAPPLLTRSVDLPAWAIYLMFGLLLTVIMSLVVVLAIVLKTRRF
jgi:photosystem II stability/assembly factor-like uncharacterized protein